MIYHQKKVSKLLRSLQSSGNKGIAWLVDPDKILDLNGLRSDFSWIQQSNLDLIFVGGSQFDRNNFDEVVLALKDLAGEIPVVIFPGSHYQLTQHADAILFLSLISGRNPEFLIGHQVLAAPIIQKMGLEVLPTGYLLINEHEITSVQYISQTTPIPNSKPNLAKATALAGQFLGMTFFFLDAGSGSSSPVSSEVIQAVREVVAHPIIVGGGIDSIPKLKSAFLAGADLLVLGNSVEKDPGFLVEALAFKAIMNRSLHVN
ncbi:MAG: phosphoglycerol geranylgeranyltransferase [Algoriphagus sp.]|jgi:phosphoglycerol geranylgeranyltransferase